MINRKNSTVIINGNKSVFWAHYHDIFQMCQNGNESIHERVQNYLEEKDLLLRHYSLANIPEKYFPFEIDRLKMKWATIEANSVAIANIERYLNSLDQALKLGIGLYIYGPHGVAKTTLSTIILKKAIQHYYRGFFYKSAEIVEFARAGWKNEDKAAFYEYLNSNIDFLVIDDLARLLDANSGEKLYIDKIFAKRDDMNLPTIITSNKTVEEIKTHFGEALYSNFKERLIPINLIGDDYRDTIGDTLLEKL
jgi:DNA replication protein DnaC